MSNGPVHISDVMARAFSKVTGGRDRFHGMRLNEFTYPDYHSAEATLFNYRLPFEDCCEFALGDAVRPRRFVVPDVLLSDKLDIRAREQLIEAVARLYCAAWLDCARASFNRCTADGSGASLVTHIKELKQLLARFENAVKLLTCSPVASVSVLAPWHEPNHLAKAIAQAMLDGFNVLIHPTLWYENGGLRAVNIRTEFTPEQWLNHLHLACSTALGHAKEFPPLPRLLGDETEGYVFHLHEHETAQVDVCSAPPNQSDAIVQHLRRANR